MITSPGAALLLALQGKPVDPTILVKIVEPNPKTLADVVLGAIGLTGVLVAIAIVFGGVFAGVLFLARSRDPLKNASQGSQADTPP